MKGGFIIAFIFLTFLLSCNRYSDAPDESFLNLPHRIEIFNPYLDKIPDSSDLFSEKSKIYTLINASCATCIPFLYDLDSFNRELDLQKKDAYTIAICRSDDNFQIIKYFFESGKMKKIQIPLVLDLDDKFISLNPNLLNNDLNGLQILTNENNKIWFIGSIKENKKQFLKLIPNID